MAFPTFSVLVGGEKGLPNFAEFGRYDYSVAPDGSHWFGGVTHVANAAGWGGPLSLRLRRVR